MTKMVSAKSPTAAAVSRADANHQAARPNGWTATSMADIEKLEDGKTFQRWFDRFAVAARFYKWTEEEKAEVLLMRLSPTLYDTLADRIAPDLPSTKTFDELEVALQEILLPRSYVLAERYNFQNARRETTESVRNFAERLLKASDKCHFNNRDERLRDQFICGLNDKNILAKLLVKDHQVLSFREAVAEAEAYSSLKETQIMQTAPTPRAESIMEIGKKATSKPSRSSQAKWRPRAAQVDHPGGAKERCLRCGGRQHDKSACPAIGKTCRKCGKPNHFERQCRSKRTGQQQHYVAQDNNLEDVLHAIRPGERVTSTSVTLNCKVNGREQPVTCQIDTGASVSVMSSKLWSDLGKPKLQATNSVLVGYTDGHKFKMLGQLQTEATWKERSISITFQVVQSDRNFALLGRDIVNINLESIIIGHSTVTQQVGQQEQPSKRFKATLQLVDGAVPRYLKARPVPFAVRDKLKKEIDSLCKDGIIEPVTFSEWASPIVLVQKPNGEIRLCVDYKQTVNPQLKNDSYPSPTPEEAFSAVAGCKFYTILDLKKAYNQVDLDESSKDLTVMSTPFGNYRYNRLVFGIKTAPSIFQRFISEVIQGIDGAVAYVDDILIGGASKDELQRREAEVRDRLKKHNLKVNEEKCQVLKSRVRFLGFVLDSGSVRPDDEKVKALRSMSAPKNIAELESFLGLVNFSGRFVRNLAELVEPLTRLKRKDTEFIWTAEQETAFQRIKGALSSNAMLVSYDPKKSVELECDASQVAIGGVLSQEGRPIIFVSKVLSPAEKRYSQIEREALAIVWAMRRCHRFLYGREFSLVTDHRPLTFIFGPNSQLPERVSARLQRWAILLSGYNYTISYRKSADMKSDALSRLVDASVPATTHHVGIIPVVEGSLLTMNEIMRFSKECCELKLLREAVRTGNFNNQRVRAYKAIADELATQDMMVIRGSKLVLPVVLRRKAVNAAHSVHLGMQRTKSILRDSYWWPGMNKLVEQCIGSCIKCKWSKPHNRNFRTTWAQPEGPWQRVHVDFAGPIQDKYLLVIVDAFSNYPEVHVTRDMTSKTVIERLRRTFSQMGVPQYVVSDNGPSFCSHETQTWLNRIGCTPITSPAYHPQSNGLAERFVRTLKEAIKANGFSQAAVDRYLLFYRSSIGKTGSSPAEILMGRKLRVPLQSTVGWTPNEDVIYKAGRQTCNGTLVTPLGQNTAIIRLEDGQLKKAHLDQLQRLRSGNGDNDQARPTTETSASGLGSANETPSESKLSMTSPSEPAGPQEALEHPSPEMPRRSVRLQEKPKVCYKE